MKVYFIKMALRGISPMIWRRFCLSGNLSLANFHQIIQIAYEWEDEHLHQFHIYGKDYGISYLGGIVFSDNAHEVFIEDFEFDVGDKFTYEYNFFKHIIVDIRIERIKDTLSTPKSLCLKGQGMFGVEKHEETLSTLNLLKALVNANDSTPIEDIYPLIETVNAVKFNHHRINKKLQCGMI